MSKPNVLVLFNQPLLARDHPDAEQEHAVVAVARLVARTLKEASFGVELLGLGADPMLLWKHLRKHRPDVAFNLFEGHLHNPETESYVAGLLDWAGVAYTGSPFATLALARAKHTTKYLLKGAGLPTADFQVVEELPAPRCGLPFPVLVKPAAQDASVGVDQKSVCTNARQLARRVKHLFAAFGPPVLIEEYVPGRELNVSLMESPELIALPPAEIVFDTSKAGIWPIYTYDAKWEAGTAEFDGTPSIIPDDLSAAALRRLNHLAMKAFRLLGCRDYARVDFRVKPNGQAYLLEVNPNPDISAEADLTRCLIAAGRSHADFIRGLVERALARRRGLG